jgi:hypothetical protein
MKEPSQRRTGNSLAGSLTFFIAFEIRGYIYIYIYTKTGSLNTLIIGGGVERGKSGVYIPDLITSW